MSKNFLLQISNLYFFFKCWSLCVFHMWATDNQCSDEKGARKSAVKMLVGLQIPLLHPQERLELARLANVWMELQAATLHMPSCRDTVEGAYKGARWAYIM